MEDRIYDEVGSRWYEKQGEYYIPCLSFPEKDSMSFGLWGQRYFNYSQYLR